MNLISVNTKRKCQICEKSSWCSYDEERGVTVCRRVSGGLQKSDKNGIEYWVYTSQDKFQVKPQKSLQKKSSSDSNIEKAEPEILDKVYNSLLNKITLSKSHFENLSLKRKIPLDQIIVRKYKTLKNSDRKMIAESLVNEFGVSVCMKIPGLYQDSNLHWRLSGCEGLLIPARNIDGLIIALKIRSEGMGKYIWLSSKSKGGTGPGAPIHFPLGISYDSKILRITEGELKADIANIFTGLPTISLPGVGTWKSIIPILNKLNPSLVKIAFDSDFEEKRAVAQSLVKLCGYLKLTNFKYEVEVWKTTKV